MRFAYFLVMQVVVTTSITTNALLDNEPGVPVTSPASTVDIQFLHQLLLQEQQTRLEVQKQVTTFQNQIDNVNEKLEAFKNELAGCQANNSNIAAKLASLENKIASQANPDPAIAFFARLKTNIKNHHQSDVMVFDDVQLNEGSAYDPSRGVFVATTPGLYSFQIVLSSNYASEHGRFMVNGRVITEIYADRLNSNLFGRGTGVVVLKLNQGDEVWIQHPDTGNGVVNGGIYSSFSGYLIHQV